MSIVYGPVDSWRLGRSLGVDLIDTDGRVCSFDCIYCQIRNLQRLTSKRQKFVELDEVRDELIQALTEVGEQTDYVTLSGMGEPTLASNMDDAIELITELTDKPKAILTNGCFFDREDVRNSLSKLDYVIAELDAAEKETFKIVDRPAENINFDEIIRGYKDFRDEYSGKFSLEVMFVEGNIEHAEEIAHLAREIGADEIQINTPLRPSDSEPISRDRLNEVEDKFKGMRTINVYDIKREKGKILDREELEKRGRPSN